MDCCFWRLPFQAITPRSYWPTRLSDGFSAPRDLSFAAYKTVTLSLFPSVPPVLFPTPLPSFLTPLNRRPSLCLSFSFPLYPIADATPRRLPRLLSPVPNTTFILAQPSRCLALPRSLSLSRTLLSPFRCAAVPWPSPHFQVLLLSHSRRDYCLSRPTTCLNDPLFFVCSESLAAESDQHIRSASLRSPIGRSWRRNRPILLPRPTPAMRHVFQRSLHYSSSTGTSGPPRWADSGFDSGSFSAISGIESEFPSLAASPSLAILALADMG